MADGGITLRMQSLLLAAVCAAFCLALPSCATAARVPVPGEADTVRTNIYTEYLAIADAYNDLAKYDKAVQYYQYAMKSRKLYWGAYYKLGRAYALSKNWDEAEKIYKRLLRRDPENLNIRLSLAYITAMAGDLKRAEEMYGALCEENPQNADVLVNYVNILITAGKLDEAEEKLAALKEQFADNKNIEDFEKRIAAARSEQDSGQEDGAEEISESGEDSSGGNATETDFAAPSAEPETDAAAGE